MICSRTFAFVFVCQAGPLEIKAILLAASLRRYTRCTHDVIAAIPSPPERWGTPAPATLELLADLGARAVPIANDIDPAYSIGNKVSCLRIPTGADRLIFLDTDMLLADEFRDDPRFDLPLAAKPADVIRALDPRQWKRAYAAAGLTPPPGRVTTSLYGQMAPPYFNAGFLAVDPATGIGDTWLDCCRRIDARWGIRLKRPHLDQIALPVAVHKLGLPYECLEQRYNYPAHLKPIDPENPPLFAHYHTPQVLRREPLLVEVVRQLCEEHPRLAERLRSDADYAPLLVPRTSAYTFMPSEPNRLSEPPATDLAFRTARSRPPAAHAARAPELIITGIPRSGTSYLCNLLHRFENCVVLNEPEEVSRPIRKEPIPYGVGTFYRDVRRDILEGRPVRNKLRDGKVTDETLEANESTPYSPAVAGADFVLGVKNPLGFLSRLGGLRRAMPRARMVACVRNPFDTIASWKSSFPHLASADVASLSPGGLRDPFLSDRNRAALEEVAEIKDVTWRRAAWWCYLAGLILDARPRLIVVPYATAVADPESVLEQVMEGFRPGALREPIAPSASRIAKRSVLDAEDLQAIHALCGEAAAALGVADVRREVQRGAGLDYRAWPRGLTCGGREGRTTPVRMIGASAKMERPAAAGGDFT